MMGDLKLLTDGGGIHHALTTALTFALHQPQGNSHHLIALLTEQGGSRGAIHPTGEAH